MDTIVKCVAIPLPPVGRSPRETERLDLDDIGEELENFRDYIQTAGSEGGTDELWVDPNWGHFPCPGDQGCGSSLGLSDKLDDHPVGRQQTLLSSAPASFLSDTTTSTAPVPQLTDSVEMEVSAETTSTSGYREVRIRSPVGGDIVPDIPVSQEGSNHRAHQVV